MYPCVKIHALYPNSGGGDARFHQGVPQNEALSTAKAFNNAMDISNCRELACIHAYTRTYSHSTHTNAHTHIPEILFSQAALAGHVRCPLHPHTHHLEQRDSNHSVYIIAQSRIQEGLTYCWGFTTSEGGLKCIAIGVVLQRQHLLQKSYTHTPSLIIIIINNSNCCTRVRIPVSAATALVFARLFDVSLATSVFRSTCPR